MDNHFNPGYMSYPQNQSPHPQQGHLASFGNLSAPAQQPPPPPSQPPAQHQQPPQHQQQHDSPVHPTLPPLQNQNAGFAQFGSLSYAHPASQSHTPTTPHTPVTSANVANPPTNAFSHVGPPSAMGPPSSFNNSNNPNNANPNSNFSLSQSMMFPSSTATSLPPTTSAHGLPTIRPMPPGGVSGPLSSLPSLNTAQMSQQQPPFLQNEETPTHVVGSQGRRGILPSAPGRPNPPAPGTGQAGRNMIPQKDADGKFPCPHCNKTYLHAKHLKRHMLRHTGDRPYSCHLCKDTFSRSDILKRHFQKCSIRRGNPTGANHLAHQRRATNGNGGRLSISQQDGPIGLASLPEISGSSGYNSAGMIDHSPTVTGDVSSRTSRANSLITSGTMSHRNSVAGLGILGHNPPGATDQMQTSQPAFAPGIHAYGLSNASNAQHMPPTYAFSQPHMNGTFFNHGANPQPMSFLGQQSSRFDHSHNSSPHQQSPTREDDDSARVFASGGQDGFIGGSLPPNASSQPHDNIRPEQDQKPFTNDMGNDLTAGGPMGLVWS